MCGEVAVDLLGYWDLSGSIHNGRLLSLRCSAAVFSKSPRELRAEGPSGHTEWVCLMDWRRKKCLKSITA